MNITHTKASSSYPPDSSQGFFFFNVSAVINATDHFVLHTWQVLFLPSLYQNHMVLLQVVSLPWYPCRNLPPGAQPDTHTLPICRVRLLGFSNDHFENNPFQLRSPFHGIFLSHVSSLFRRSLVHSLQAGHAIVWDGV